ncbi:FHA domain-containing protein [Ilumatobacter sp.]|uniref:FHA domain-containing protein n=1 Tax=Ilumatobacter sp. TaxID=1967498 RepID=UPI003753AE43
MNDRETYSRVRIGRGVAILLGRTHALLDERNGELADRLWASIIDGGDIDTILEELSATGLRSLGDFALAEREEVGIRFVVRGSGRVTITDSGGSVVLDAGEARTWVETVVEDAQNFLLQVGGEPLGETLAFRVSSGIVPADAVSWGAPDVEGSVDGQNLEWVDDFVPVRPLPAVDPATLKTVAHSTGAQVAEPEGDLRLVDERDDTPTENPDVVDRSAPSDDSAELPIDSPVTSSPSLAFDAGLSEPLAASRGDGERGVTLIDGGLIANSVDTILPGGLGPDSARPTDEATASAGGSEHVEDDGDDDGLEYDALFGETTYKSVDRAAVEREPESIEEPPQILAPEQVTDPASGRVPDPVSPISMGGLISGVPPGESPVPKPDQAAVLGAGDHDGRTVSLAQLRAMRAQSSDQPPQATAPALGGATVQALICSAGHASPPQAVVCRVCGHHVSGSPVVIARPTLGRLVASTGQVIELDRPAVLGRRPKAEGSIPTEVPNMVALGELQGLSRSHAAIRLEQWQVLLEDLGSANGTVVTLPGREPRRLHEGDPVLLENGALIELGGEVTLTLDLGS